MADGDTAGRRYGARVFWTPGLMDPDAVAWMEDALCAQTDPEEFFPEKGGTTRHAKAVCLACDVREECLQYALDHDERFGVWGGLSDAERRRMKRAGISAVGGGQSGAA